MIEWFESLSVYLKPLVLMAIAGVVMLAVRGSVLMYEKIYLMKRGRKRTLLRIAFLAAAVFLIYAVIVGLLRLK